MTPDGRAEYIVACIREAGSMYPQDAAAFLAEHDAHRRTEVLDEVADAFRQMRGEDGVPTALLGMDAVLTKLAELARKDTGSAIQAPAGESTQPATHDALRQQLATALGQAPNALAVTQVLPLLARAVEHRDHWHAELMCADARIAELDRKATATPAPTMPRTEPSFWDAIADALNAAAAADIHIGIDMNGSALTDFSSRSITYDQPNTRWVVVCTDCDRPLTKSCGHCRVCDNCLDCGNCSGTDCTCKCEAAQAEPAPDFFQVGHGYTHRDGSDFLCIAVTTHPATGEPRALGWIIRNGWHDAGALDPDDWAHAYDGCEPPVGGDA